MRKLSLTALLVATSSSALLVFACDADVSGPPPAVPVAPPPAAVDAGLPIEAPPAPLADAAPPPAALDAAADLTSSAPDAGAGADYFACKTNADCVAVPKVGCCHNGHMVAVSKGAGEAAYQSSFVCADPHPICPQYIVKETRVPRCSPSLHKCELVGRGVYVK